MGTLDQGQPVPRSRAPSHVVEGRRQLRTLDQEIVTDRRLSALLRASLRRRSPLLRSLDRDPSQRYGIRVLESRLPLQTPLPSVKSPFNWTDSVPADRAGLVATPNERERRGSETRRWRRGSDGNKLEIALGGTATGRCRTSVASRTSARPSVLHLARQGLRSRPDRARSALGQPVVSERLRAPVTGRSSYRFQR